MVAPLTSVLPAFIEVKHETKKPELGERDKELLDLRQQMDMLRRDIRLGRVRGVEPTREIGPEQALVIIRDYLARGMPVEEIIRRLAPLGPPSNWIARQVARIEGKEQETSASASSPEAPKESGGA
jgi:hypothetical protein